MTRPGEPEQISVLFVGAHCTFGSLGCLDQDPASSHPWTRHLRVRRRGVVIEAPALMGLSRPLRSPVWRCRWNTRSRCWSGESDCNEDQRNTSLQDGCGKYGHLTTDVGMQTGYVSVLSSYHSCFKDEQCHSNHSSDAPLPSSCEAAHTIALPLPSRV
jgi:hypothetical protein